MGLKLFRVTCRGMTSTLTGSATHGVAYVVSENAADAYSQVRSRLDKCDLGFPKDRSLDKVELLAEETPEGHNYPECLTTLYLGPLRKQP